VVSTVSSGIDYSITLTIAMSRVRRVMGVIDLRLLRRTTHLRHYAFSRYGVRGVYIPYMGVHKRG